jgi:GNAT superfamily N-acetyltransferase
MKYKLINSQTGDDKIFTPKKIASFLKEHLEQYGDNEEHILKCIDYAMKRKGGRGGFIQLGLLGGDLAGIVVINETGMGGYIPENILVYIAMHRNLRGKGLGKLLMTEAIEHCTGDVALHVEKDNPARFLYENLGFTNPYLEMRLNRPAIEPIAVKSQ